jgi:hypothetical protein
VLAAVEVLVTEIQEVQQPYPAQAFHSQLLAVVAVVVIQDGVVVDFSQALVRTGLTTVGIPLVAHLQMAELMAAMAAHMLEALTQLVLVGQDKMENSQLLSKNIDYQVIDNFLPEEEFKNIQDLMMGDHFAWHYHKTVTYADEEKDDKAFYFTHLFYSNPKITSEHIQTLNPLLEKLDVKAFIRIKGNMYPNLNGYSPNEPHIDYPYSHKGAIFYINTNDGCTILEDGTRIASVANRILFFDPSKMHDSTYPSDQKVRVNININYF